MLLTFRMSAFGFITGHVNPPSQIIDFFLHKCLAKLCDKNCTLAKQEPLKCPLKPCFKGYTCLSPIYNYA